MKSIATIANALALTTNTISWPYPEKKITYVIRQKQQATPTADPAAPRQTSKPTEMCGDSFSINIVSEDGRSKPLLRVTAEYSSLLPDAQREKVAAILEEIKDRAWECL